MNSAFNEQILAEKLKKLNNTQQSIETLSHWCIFHRKRAHTVVETWDKHLRELPKEQQVPFLYLANDILQNSRRRGLEFVREFWKVLPRALKDVIEKGDSRAHTVVFRLVDIWDERKVFGSRTRTLREELLGNDPPADLPERRVKSNHTIKIKVPAGGIQEKLSSAYRSVQDVVSDEDATLGRCNAAAIRVDSLEKEANVVQGEAQDTTTLVEELQGQQQILSHCIEQLEMCELARAALVSCLKEALREQESKLELIRSQRQTARAQVEHATNLCQRLLSSGSSGAGEIVQFAPKGNDSHGASEFDREQYQQPPPKIEGMVSVIDEPKKPPSAASAAAAEVAAKLAASSSSAQVLTSVLSSMVAEEASKINNSRSMTAPLDSSTGSLLGDKRQRLYGQNDVLQGSDGILGNARQPSTASMSFQSPSIHQYSSPMQPHILSSQVAPSHYPIPPPAPPFPPFNMGMYASGAMQPYGYIGVAPPPTLGIQGQVFPGASQAVMNPYAVNVGPYPALQSPGVSTYGQTNLPASHPPTS
ncbi:hypothetical protein KP509_05G038400 [Ceratopteris richardii]|uniref:CID domain-containing protein n=1 Tax=Ceratopteris richardii TaxID=49495 RepID=A0A8T2UTB2_CERRI|nr:hypothetical protein KP509_05G038400 [Ceratopteris richardii]KAH7436844.1 hypothetical protein KP509_05G038400 [Ceratopteris richardii]KAH7436845.1 hypothetical protein KP509_05G038400 [Ceratopteris richardii]KAH7436846.1 hypothetical protein KP509_05G038400 [Ceratopteris richardii]